MKTKRILIVEDEGIVARDLQKTLTRIGYDVIGIAYSGEDAVKKAGEEKPDLVLMDIVLHGEVDGIAAAEDIRKNENTPVVYLTAYADSETLQRAKVTEPFGYILKPFRERELHTSIEMALYKHAMDMEREKLIKDLKEAMGWVKTLEGLLPICSHCKKIRNKKGEWKDISSFLQDYSRADFTHGICPECTVRYYPQFSRKDKRSPEGHHPDRPDERAPPPKTD